MQLLADENIQQVTVRFLSERGWDILWAADEGLSGAPDERIFEHAQRRRRILLTYNAHFADIRELAIHAHHGVIRLRYSNQRVDFVHAHLLAALDHLKGQDLRDTLVTLTDDRIRIRKTLPFRQPSA
jgi:predicted nuclease of predicted toxin-antitoxin system